MEEKLRQSKEAPLGAIYLYRQGGFFRAYERCAWMFCKVVKPFQVNMVGKGEGASLYIGMPLSVLDKYSNGRTLEKPTQDVYLLRLTAEETAQLAEAEFAEWRTQMAAEAAAMGEKVRTKGRVVGADLMREICAQIAQLNIAELTMKQAFNIVVEAHDRLREDPGSIVPKVEFED